MTSCLGLGALGVCIRGASGLGFKGLRLEAWGLGAWGLGALNVGCVPRKHFRASVCKGKRASTEPEPCKLNPDP